MITQNQLKILKENIQNIIQLFVNKKFELWLITHYYDSKYISDFSEISTEEKKNNQITQLAIQDTQHDLNSRIKETSTINLDDIYHTKNIYLKYKKVLNITNDSHNITLKDSFYGNGYSADEIFNTFSNNTFSNNNYHTYKIIIFGAGPCGLYMANILKSHYKEKIEILIIENRISDPHTKNIYSRKWLTNIPSSIFKGVNQIKDILKDFGKENYIGCHINVFETLLYLSCRKMNVKFLFENIDIENLSCLKNQNQNIDLIFNATGNRLFQNKSVPTSIVNIPFNFEKVKLNNLNYYGNNFNPNTNISNIQLETRNDILYSKYNNGLIKWNIIKITNIPITKYDDLKRFVKILNVQDNKLYLWKGTFKEEINECLLFINVMEPEIEMLMGMNKNIRLDILMSRPNFDKLSDKIIILCQYLQYLYPINNIIVEKPFIYRPYINTKPIIHKYNNTIINIGDSIFNGDPKLGDGLGWHLDIINKITDSIKRILT
jgi:hypothetical protein